MTSGESLLSSFSNVFLLVLSAPQAGRASPSIIFKVDISQGGQSLKPLQLASCDHVCMCVGAQSWSKSLGEKWNARVTSQFDLVHQGSQEQVCVLGRSFIYSFDMDRVLLAPWGVARWYIIHYTVGCMWGRPCLPCHVLQHFLDGLKPRYMTRYGSVFMDVETCLSEVLTGNMNWRSVLKAAWRILHPSHTGAFGSTGSVSGVIMIC